MIVPVSIVDLARLLSAAQTPIGRIDLSHLCSLVEHAPEDMTATVEAGMTLADLQKALRKQGQWIPLDPPDPSAVTVGDLLAYDLSGPRRYGYGSVREYTIGMRVVLSSGEVVKAGGKVVKNVAGYDLCRLFIAARHALGIIVEATFKLRPLPEGEVILQARCGSLAAAQALAARLGEAGVDPVILDVHNVTGELTLVLAFAGLQEDVNNQVEAVRNLGITESATLDYSRVMNQKVSVLPSRIFDLLAELDGARFVARLGNGIVHHNHASYEKPPADLPTKLFTRVKQAYDPKRILPDYLT